MSKYCVLISAIGGDIGQSVARSLSGDFRVFGCDMHESVSAKLFVEKFFCVPSVSQDKVYLSAIQNIFEREKIDVFIPISESEIIFLNNERDWIASMPVKVAINTCKTIEIFSDKLKTAVFIHSYGMRVPRTVLLKDLVRKEWCFPLIVKARQGWGSKNVYKVVDDLELEYLCKRDHGDLIAQEYLEETEGEFTTGIFSDGINVESITFLRSLGFGGLSREVRFVHDAKLDEIAQSIARKIELIGSINIQSRKVNGEYIPFEVNPRLSSTVFLRHYFGFKDVRWWIDYMYGRGFKYNSLYRYGVAARVLTEYFMDMEKL